MGQFKSVCFILILISLISCQGRITKKVKGEQLEKDSSYMALQSLDKKKDCAMATYWKNRIVDEIGVSGKMNATQKYVINYVEDLCGTLEDRITAYECGHEMTTKEKEKCLKKLHKLGGENIEGIVESIFTKFLGTINDGLKKSEKK